ncbi:MAG: tetratricopeptide repeat protein [Victivallaceae bacterium]|nr:tetratricopeptide repeat protein [Victivallaceae bacterium]
MLLRLPKLLLISAICLIGLLLSATDFEKVVELRQAGNYSRAEKLLEQYSSPAVFDTLKPAEKIDFLNGLLELAHVRALKDDVPGALALLNWAESREDPYQRAIACVKYAEILIDLGEFERASGYLKNADEVIVKRATDENRGVAIGQGGEVTDSGGTWRNLRDYSDALKAEVESEEMKKKFGATYGNYVKLRRLQRIVKRSRTPRYRKEAMKLADEIMETDPASQFAAAAGCLKGEIMAARLKEDSPKQETKEAKNYLEKFVRQQPDGLYRGEALMLLGKISLEIEWNAKEAEKYYSQALEWFRKAREKRDAVSLYAAINDDLKKQSAPTQKPTSFTGWDRIKYHQEDPLKLYNTASSPSWYIEENEKQCLFRVGFFKVAQGKFAEAKPFFIRVLECDPELKIVNSKGTPNIVSRLQAVCDYKRMIFTEDELAKLNSKERLKICTGDLYYITSQFDEAKMIYESVLVDNKSSISAKACALAGIANCLEMGDNNFRLALGYFKRIITDKEFKKTALAPRALFRYAENIYSSANMKDAIEPFEECVKKYPETEFGELSMFKLVAIEYFYNRHRGDAMYKRYMAKYPAANYKRNIDYMVKIMEKDRGEKW